jgi:predicted nucleic acid-binding protein
MARKPPATRVSAGLQAAEGSTWGGLPEGCRVVVDTAPVIYVLESHPVHADAFRGLFEAAAQGELTIAMSAITLAEVLTGPCKAGKTTLAKRYEQALCQYEVIPVTVPIASLAAHLRALHNLRLPDALQLATAVETGAAALVTHDRDFSAVTDLPILTGATR